MTLSIATQGFLARGTAPTLAIAIQGFLSLAVVTAEAHHIVTPSAVVRQVTVDALGAIPGTFAAGRMVTVAAVSRETAVQAVIRSVVAEPAEREV